MTHYGKCVTHHHACECREEKFLQMAVDLARITEQRDDLAMTALCALSGSGIPTPEKGYVAEPYCLSFDIQSLAKQRDMALAEVERQRDALLCADRYFRALAGEIGANLQASLKSAAYAVDKALQPQTDAGVYASPHKTDLYAGADTQGEASDDARGSK